MSGEGTTIVLNKNVFYRRVGDPNNPTLVLLHGLGRSMEQWEPVVEGLSENFDIFMFDLPGFGGTDDFEPPEVNMSFPMWLMEKLFTKFEIEKPILLGESFGGLLALEYTLKRPGNVSKLALMDSAGLGHKIRYIYRIATIPVLGEAIVLEDSRDTKKSGLNFKDPRVISRILFNTIRFSLFRHTKFGDPRRVFERAEYNNIRLLRYGVGLRGQRETINRVSQLKDIQTPTLILHGLEDDIFPIEQAVRAYKLFPNAWGNGPVFFKEGKHFPLEEDEEARKKFIRVVTEFGCDE